MVVDRWLRSPRWTSPNAAWTLVFLRLAFGYHLVQYSAPTLFDAAGRGDFAQFLASKGMPFPAFAGVLSMGAELAGGLALVSGLFLRPACAILLVNFGVALVLVHRGQPYMKSFEALQMLAVAATLLGTGAGPLSGDAWLFGRRTRDAPRTLA